MTHVSKQQGQNARAAAHSKMGSELMRAKMELVAARERGEADALGRVLATYPSQAADLVEFSASLVATTGYTYEMLTPAAENIAARARTRALAAVFPTAPAPSTPQRAMASLKALRQARGLSTKALAQRLSLGLDVVSSLEAGLIRVASVPDRLVRALGDVLGVTRDQVAAALQSQAMLMPAMQRGKDGMGKGRAEQPELDFAEAVRLSPGMSTEQKARWLEE